MSNPQNPCVVCSGQKFETWKEIRLGPLTIRLRRRCRTCKGTGLIEMKPDQVQNLLSAIFGQNVQAVPIFQTTIPLGAIKNAQQIKQLLAGAMPTSDASLFAPKLAAQILAQWAAEHRQKCPLPNCELIPDSLAYIAHCMRLDSDEMKKVPRLLVKHDMECTCPEHKRAGATTEPKRT